MAAGGCRRRPAACRDEPGTKNLQETGAVSMPRAGQTRGCPPPGPPCLPVCALKAKAFSPGSQRGRPRMPRLRFPSIVAPRRQLCAGKKAFWGSPVPMRFWQGLPVCAREPAASAGSAVQNQRRVTAFLKTRRGQEKKTRCLTPAAADATAPGAPRAAQPASGVGPHHGNEGSWRKGQSLSE